MQGHLKHSEKHCSTKYGAGGGNTGSQGRRLIAFLVDKRKNEKENLFLAKKKALTDTEMGYFIWTLFKKF